MSEYICGQGDRTLSVPGPRPPIGKGHDELLSEREPGSEGGRSRQPGAAGQRGWGELASQGRCGGQAAGPGRSSGGVGRRGGRVRPISGETRAGCMLTWGPHWRWTRSFASMTPGRAICSRALRVCSLASRSTFPPPRAKQRSVARRLCVGHTFTPSGLRLVVVALPCRARAPLLCALRCCCFASATL